MSNEDRLSKKSISCKIELMFSTNARNSLKWLEYRMWLSYKATVGYETLLPVHDLLAHTRRLPSHAGIQLYAAAVGHRASRLSQ